MNNFLRHSFVSGLRTLKPKKNFFLKNSRFLPALSVTGSHKQKYRMEFIRRIPSSDKFLASASDSGEQMADCLTLRCVNP